MVWYDCLPLDEDEEDKRCGHVHARSECQDHMRGQTIG
jgi:hypothetical protein